MHYVILRDDDTNALTPVGCLEQLYRPFLDTWNVYLNGDDAELVAHGTPDAIEITRKQLFESLVKEFSLQI